MSSPPRSYSPLKSCPSEEIQAFPLEHSPVVSSLQVPQQTLLQVTFEALQRLLSSLQPSTSATSTSGSAQREALDRCCKHLVQIAARAQDLSVTSIRSLLSQIKECRDLVNGHQHSEFSALAPEFARLGVFQDALSLVLEQKLTEEIASVSARSPDNSAQEISELKSALVQLTGCVQHLMGDSGSKQYQLFGNGQGTLMGQESPGNMLDGMYNGTNDWGQPMPQAPSRELSLTRMQHSGAQHNQQQTQMTPNSLLDGMNGDQLKRLAVQGLMHQLSPQPTYAPVPQVNVHNMISTDAHAAAATEQNSTQQNSIVTKVKNTIKQARANLIPLLIGGAAALLLHNHLPVLKHISPGGGGRSRKLREDLQRERTRTRRTAATAEEALEECYESMREWREYSRRARGPFQHVPEPSGKCDLRALRSRVIRSASSSSDTTRPSGLETDDSSVEGAVWRSLLP